MSEHTPTPWKAIERGDQEVYAAIDYIIEAEGGIGIAAIFGGRGRANAEFVVRACNSFDDLLAALELATPTLQVMAEKEKQPALQRRIWRDIYEHAQAARAKARIRG